MEGVLRNSVKILKRKETLTNVEISNWASIDFFFITLLCDWSKKLSPVSKTVRCKTRTNTKFSKSYSSLNSHLGTIQLHNQRPTTTSACVKNCHVTVDRKSNWPKLKRISFVTVRSVRRINYPWEMKTGTVMKMWDWYYELGRFIRYIKSWILGRLGYHFKTAPLSYLAFVYHYNR